MQPIPEWAKKQRLKGTEIKHFKGNYYLYEVCSEWDSNKKRAKKKSGKYLGKLTKEGLIKPKHERVLEGLDKVTIKEFGATEYICNEAKGIVEKLKAHFPYNWKEILVLAVERLFYSSPLKNASAYYATSHLSDLFPDARVSPKSLSQLLHTIGRERGRTVGFMRNFIRGTQFAAIDLTHVFSLSDTVISSTLGRNSDHEFVPQLNLILLFSEDCKEPIFFRIVPGSIRDVSIIPAAMAEAGIKNATVIGDKGFYSEDNVKFLESKKLHYILPLRRNSSLIDYGPIETGNRKSFDGYLMFDERIIWHYERKIDNQKKLILFLDERLKTEEEKDFISHVESEMFTINEYYERQYRLGTIAVLTNLNADAKTVYERLKGRMEIEVAFDTFKNLLHADRTYLRDDRQIEGWMLINFVALLLYYRLYRTLVSKDILRKYSPKDVIIHLSRIQKFKVNDRWQVAEIPKASRKIVEKLDIKLHIT